MTLGFRKLFILLAALLLQACGGGGSSGGPAASSPQAPQACSVATQRQQLLDFMTNNYYWYSQMPAPDASAATLDAYFESMLYRPTDRFSFSEPTTAYKQLFEDGTFTGYGYALVVTDPVAPVLRVRQVEPKGPANAAGLRRGDTIVSIDGFTPAQVLAGAVGSVGTEGVARTFVVRDVAGNLKTLQAVSATFPLTPVRDVEVLTGTGPQGQQVKVGYIDYTQFVTYSENDLTAAVQQFASQGATELVLDLRYNGGGDIGTSRQFASLVAGARLAGQVFASLRFNDRNTAKNQDYRFALPPASIGNLARVFVIASGSTASASELVINGLKPFMDVVLIGDTTYGKPYGFEPYDNCGTTYNAVNFEVFNAAGQGGYTSGFAPTCPVADDLDHAMGDPNELRLRAALGYITTGSCPQAPQSASLGGPATLATMARVQPVLGDVRPPGMFRR